MNNSTKDELLGHHLPYELLMLRYAHREIQLTQPALRWNALLESFATHARALHEFLTGKSDNRNAHATDLIPAFKPKKPEKVRGKIDALNQKILHLGTTRTASADNKVDLSDANTLFDWIETNIALLLDQLTPNDKVLWKPERSEIGKADTTYIIAPVSASATNHIQIIRSQSTT
jgi:hypothetical protein